MIKAIVFDFDSTLSDRRRVIQEIGARFYREKRQWIPAGVSWEEFGRELFESDRNYNHTGWDAAHRDLVRRGFLSEKCPEQALFRFVHREYGKVGFLEEGTRQMLLDFRRQGYRLGLITNGVRREIQEKKLELVNLPECFDAMLICVEPEQKKPNLWPFLEMAGRLGTRPEEMIYVGDNPKNDIEPARRAGYLPVWVSQYTRWDFPNIEKPEICLSSVLQLPVVLETTLKSSAGAENKT